MSAQGALFTPPAVRPAPRLHFLYGLDAQSPRYPRDAAKRIAALDTRRDVEAALAEVAVAFVHFVETLVVQGLALRVAAAPHAKIRELLMDQVPEVLKVRVEPLAKSYALTRPWEKRGEA